MTEREAEEVVAATRNWLVKAVLGLDLCPFARPVHTNDQIRYAVSQAETPDDLLEDLVHELQFLSEADPAEVETTLLIHPLVLGNFLDYNDFLDVAEATVEELGLEGVLQVASFHPDYQFANTEPDAVENCTNRSPYPILHLLREESVERAVESYGDTDRIYEKNIETLRRLGHEGWKRLGVGPKRS